MKVLRASAAAAALVAAVFLPYTHADPLCDETSRSAYVFQRSKCLATAKSPNTDATGYCADASCRDALSLAEALIACPRFAAELPTIDVGANGSTEQLRIAFCSAECTDAYRQMQSALAVCQVNGKSSVGSCQGCQRYLRLVPTVVGACNFNSTTVPSSLKTAVDRDMRQCEVIVRGSTASADASTTSISPFLISGLVGGVLVLVLAMVMQKRRQRLVNAFHTMTSRKFGGRTKNTVDQQTSVHNDIRYDAAMAKYWHPQNKLSHITLRSKGGYGMVYSATLDTSDRGKLRVALKQLLPSRAQEVEHIEHFMHEIRLASSLTHPNIVPFIGFTWSNLQDVSMLTEYMAQGDLHKFLRSEFKKPPSKRTAQFSWQGTSDGTSHCTKLSVASNVIDALAYLHGQSPSSIIHRDLKSKNILLNDSLVAHITDFGVSRQSSADVDALMTARVGTSAWIAPEVLRGEKYTHQADMYSFGVLLAELDTLQEPYKDATLQPDVAKMTPSKLASNIAHGKLRPALSKTAPRFVRALASKCLAFDYNSRPSATQVAMELTSHLIQHHHRESLKMYPGGSAELVVTKTPGTSQAAYAAL